MTACMAVVLTAVSGCVDVAVMDENTRVSMNNYEEVYLLCMP